MLLTSISTPPFADAVIPITCFILVCLFALQHYGTHRIGFLFAPVVLTWLLCISSLGLYNIFCWNRQVYKALSPYYMFKFLKKTRKSGWMSLGGILLCITGKIGKQMYQANSHAFHVVSIQVRWMFEVVYPIVRQTGCNRGLIWMDKQEHIIVSISFSYI